MIYFIDWLIMIMGIMLIMIIRERIRFNLVIRSFADTLTQSKIIIDSITPLIATIHCQTKVILCDAPVPPDGLAPVPEVNTWGEFAEKALPLLIDTQQLLEAGGSAGLSIDLLNLAEKEYQTINKQG